MLHAFRERPEFDAYLALDADQTHPRDLLEKLRAAMEANDLDMVCAHYYRRQATPVQSLCYELGDGTWPFLPMLDPPTEGLHEIASTGQGCVLIHRRVIEAVWQALPAGDNPFTPAPMPEVGGDQRVFGSDMRFFILARRLGFRLWLRADVESSHALTLWLNHKTARKLMDYNRWAHDQGQVFKERLRIHGMTPEAFRQRVRLLDARKRGMLLELEQAKTEGKLDEAQAISVELHQMDGRLREMADWVEMVEQYPAVEYPHQLPGGPVLPAAEGVEDRTDVHRENAVELARELPNVGESGRNGVGHA